MKKTFLERFCDSPAKTGASLWTHRRANKHVEERTIIEVEIVILSEALLASQPRGEQTKILKFEFAPLASSTMYANTLRPRILVLTSFVWS